MLDFLKKPSAQGGAEADVNAQCLVPQAKVQGEQTAEGGYHMVAARTCGRNCTLEKMKYYILSMDTT